MPSIHRTGSGHTLAVFYEHPEWFKPLFAELERRGVPYDRLLAHEHRFNPAERVCPYALVVNRMSPSAYTRGHGNAILYALQDLAYLKEIGANVLHGYDTYEYEFSKARQISLLHRLGLRYPRARVINYDINALSNFVADAPKVIGFDPFPRLVDFLLARAGLAQAAIV